MFDSDVEVTVLDCTLDQPNYTRRFKELLDNSQIYNVMNKEFPEDPDAIIITGSTYSAPWNDEWVRMLVENTAEHIENDLPVLGFCFGQQIIADAMSGDAVDMEDYEIGYLFSTHRNKVEKPS